MRKFQASILLASIPTTLLSAQYAHATTVIGAGNSAHGNLCASHGGVTTSGATQRSTGILQGWIVGLPGSGPANQCGNLGLPYVPKNQIATREQIYGDDAAVVPK